MSKEVLIDGRKTVLTNDYDKIRFVTAQKLRELGWSIVTDERSGVYVKNGFTLFLFPNRGMRDTRKTAAGGLLSNAIKYFEEQRISWQLEKFGALIATGKLPLTMSYIFDTDYYDDKDFSAFIAAVEAYTVLPQFELRNHKIVQVMEGEDIGSFKASQSNILQTKIFLCVSDTCRIASIQRAHAYGIVRMSVDTIDFVELNDGGRVISTINTLVDKDLALFYEYAESGVLRALELTGGTGKQIVTKRLQESRAAAVPEDILRLGFSKEHNLIISEIIGLCGNVVPLLRYTDDLEALQTLAELLHVSSEYDALLAAPLDIERLQLLKQAASLGFSLHDYVMAPNVREAEVLLRENVESFDSSMEDLRRRYSVSAITALKYVSTSSNKRVQVPEGATEHHVYLQQMIDANVMRTTADTLFRNGRELDAMLYVFENALSPNAKAELRAYLACQDFVCNGEEWNTHLNRLLDDIRFTAFSKDTGIVISAGGGYVGRQPCGFVFYDAGLRPVFRAFKMNGKFVRYGDEQIICKE